MIHLNQYGFHELIDKPSPEELSEYYKKKYYQDGNIATYRHEYSEEEILYFNNKIEQKYNFLVEKSILEPDSNYSILDVGCGEGFTLNFFKKKGWEVTGMDFSSYGCKSFHPDCLDNVIEGDIYQNIEKLTKEDKQYNLIWLDNVLEHVLQPHELLKNLLNICTDNGVLIIEVPNDFSLVQNYLYNNGLLKKQNWLAIPDHISYFNKDGLENICQASNWVTLGVMSDFPIDWFLFNEHSNYYSDRTKGKAAHKARIALENLLHRESSENLSQLYEAMANAGVGRQLIGFFNKNA